jgi:hypothetical protein
MTALSNEYRFISQSPIRSSIDPLLQQLSCLTYRKLLHFPQNVSRGIHSLVVLAQTNQNQDSLTLCHERLVRAHFNGVSTFVQDCLPPSATKDTVRKRLYTRDTRSTIPKIVLCMLGSNQFPLSVPRKKTQGSWENFTAAPICSGDLRVWKCQQGPMWADDGYEAEERGELASDTWTSPLKFGYPENQKRKFFLDPQNSILRM